MAEHNNKQVVADEPVKITVDRDLSINEKSTTIGSIEVHAGGAVAIGDHATITITNGLDVERRVWWKVPGLLSRVTGRRTELKHLHESILRAEGSITVITGLGGIGKTTLAKMYAYENGVSCFDGNVVWITAEDTMSLADSFVALAQYLGVDKKNMRMDARVERVYDVFTSSNSLFVFDNAEKISTILPFLPVANPAKTTPYVIITTQITDWPDSVVIVELDNLSRSEAVDLILENLDSTKVEEEDAGLLADELQSFPLALQQAIAYIKKLKRRRNFTIKEYISLFRSKKTREMLDTLSNCHDYKKTVYVTWKLAFDRLKSSSNYELVTSTLATMAFMHADDIPFSTFMNYAQEDEDKLWEALEVLEQYCLIKKANSHETENGESEALFGIHRLVQKVVQLTLEPKDVMHHLEKTLIEMRRFVRGGYSNYTRDKQFSYHAWTVWNHGKKFESLQKKFCCLPIRITDALLYQGRYSESLAFATQEYDFLAENLGDKHHSTLAMLFNKARSYHCLSKLEDAVVFYNEAIQKQKETLGEMHCDTLASQMDLAFCYIDLQKPEISLQIFQEVYAKKKLNEQETNSDGEKPVALYSYRDIYTAMYGLGHALQLLKRYDEAEELYMAFYEQRRQTDGESHPRRLHAGNKLAEVWIEKGEYAKALELLKYVYNKQVEALGDKHPHCMMTLRNMIKGLKLKGQIDEAKRLLDKLHDRVHEVLGVEHKDTKKVVKMIEDFEKEFPE